MAYILTGYVYKYMFTAPISVSISVNVVYSYRMGSNW